MTSTVGRPVGVLLREWRERRRLSQLELSSRAEVSTRHLSFVETGRSRPTPELILRLTEQLDVPLRERNQVLLAGGYAPAYPQHGLDAPALAGVRAALRRVLDGHQPYPALVLNRWWEVQDANAALGVMTAGCAARLLAPPVNALRLSLHPDGLAPRIANLAQWRGRLLAQLQHRVERTGDPRLRALHAELLGYAGDDVQAPPPTARADDVVVPLRLRDGAAELSLFSISAAVETAADVTVDELVIECFYPADDDTAARLRALAVSPGAAPAGPAAR
ncbi:Transcriptional regulator, contains XRE-family HTH domain [Jatrophihabitans endophyticus]|uniref:Transcriptional regulator, contains XRE-family HTH domain n=1 Tax=Jatrophihabitans endophyticus TaxID=1206085 RepID=A0A1M5K5B4_9ACTN|nr:helix-turn-helix transcriptional regulator [Jatrophihabitans endophyticus]SHG47891.1 Transcriptional regulator, contains XRE-family HTH domain [Jatrophihabitans endophyticus]